MDSKLVSVVLPVHNGEKFLASSIESVLKQTHKNFELIIVDDNSDDNSLSIAKGYQLLDKRIKILSNKENLKLPKSLNRGFEEANGEYLTWTSDDNIYYNDAIEKMVRSLENNKEFDFVYTDMEKIDSVGECIGYTKSEVKDMYLYNCIGACFLYRKKCKEEIGMYDTDSFLVEDYDYWIRLSQNFKILHLPLVLYKYRFHEDSLTMSKMRMVGLQLLKIKLKYFDYLYGNLRENERENFIFELLIYDINCLDNYLDIREIVSNVKKIIPQHKLEENGYIYLYGAGNIGQQAMTYFHNMKILSFIDGNEDKVGKKIGEYEIISLEKIKEKDIPIIITTDVRTSYNIIKKLKKFEIKKYDIFYRFLEKEGV